MSDLPDERTLPARRARGDEPAAGAPAVDPPEIDESDSAVPDEATRLSGRRAAALPVEPVQKGAETPAGPRRSGADPVQPVDPDDGSTIVVRRRSDPPAPTPTRGTESPAESVDIETAVSGRSRDLASTMASDVPAPLGRLAHAPEPTGATYSARQAPPAVVTRSAAPVREPQRQLDAQASTAAARKRRRRALLVIIAASLLVVVATTVLIVIAVTG